LTTSLKCQPASQTIDSRFFLSEETRGTLADVMPL
jgi:hypothetical protein